MKESFDAGNHIKENLPDEKNNLSGYGEWDKFVFFHHPYYSFYPPRIPQIDLNIYREPIIKALIKEQSEDLYKLIKKVHFDGRYYRIKRVHYGEWEYCWDLAIQVKFFGMMQGLACEPKKIVSRKEKKIIYKSLVLINPYELWDRKLATRLWNLQERIEFLMAKILFHECIHILIFLGKTQPSSLEQTDIYLEFQGMLKFACSEELCPESCKILSSLHNLSELVINIPENSNKNMNRISELYEFLIHEKYSIKKTDLAFGLPWSNGKVSQNYAMIVALKMGHCPESNKKLWKKEVKRLDEDLKKLYNKIDENHYISETSSWH